MAKNQQPTEWSFWNWLLGGGGVGSTGTTG